MSGLNDVEAVGARVQREQQDVDLLLVLEGAQVLLGAQRENMDKSSQRRRRVAVESHKCFHETAVSPQTKLI